MTTPTPPATPTPAAEGTPKTNDGFPVRSSDYREGFADGIRAQSLIDTAQLTSTQQALAEARRIIAHQLEELNAISTALGSHEGHSSVDHIATLRQQNEALRRDEEAKYLAVLGSLGAFDLQYHRLLRAAQKVLVYQSPNTKGTFSIPRSVTEDLAVICNEKTPEWPKEDHPRAAQQAEGKP